MEFDKKRVISQLKTRPMTTSISLASMIINAALAEAKGEVTLSESSVRHICQGLIEEYKLVAEETGKHAPMVTGSEAQELFSRYALEAFQSEFPEADSDHPELPPWPENLPKDVPIPSGVVSRIGHLLGYKKAVENKILDDYYQYYDVGAVM